jgi:hypothetical protein
MKSSMKMRVIMIVAGVLFLVIVTMMIIPTTDEIQVREIHTDPETKFSDMTREKYNQLSVDEKIEYVKLVLNNVEKLKKHKKNINLETQDDQFLLLAIKGIISNLSKNENSQLDSEEITEEKQESEPIITESKQENPEQKQEITEKKQETEPIKTTEKQEVKRNDGEAKNIVLYEGVKLYLSDIENEVFNEIINTNEPESIAVMADRLKLSETEVLGISNSISETIQKEILIADDEPEPEPQPEKIEAKQEPEKKAEKVEPGEHEKFCALCKNIIPKYPPNAKLCSSCKVEAMDAGMKQKDYINHQSTINNQQSTINN